MLRKLGRSALASLVSKRRRLRLVTPFAWLILSIPAAAQIHLCPWKTEGGLKPRQGQNGVVEWGSLADGDTANDLWKLTTFVVNRDTHPRMIAWDAAGIRVENLPPGYYALTCSQPVLGRVDRTGPLYFARDGSSLNPTIYDGAAPREKSVVFGKPLTLNSQAIIQDASNTSTVSVRVTTNVALTTNGSYEIVYLIENLADSAVDVDFGIDPSVVQQFGPNKRSLKPKDYVKVLVTSPTFPYFVRFPMSISDPTSQTVTGTFDVPTMKSTAHTKAAK
jgi:hypothetical protein